MQAPGGLQAAQSELAGSASSSGRAAALAFLATCAKEHGAVHECVELLKAAAQLEPKHAGAGQIGDGSEQCQPRLKLLLHLHHTWRVFLTQCKCSRHNMHLETNKWTYILVLITTSI